MAREVMGGSAVGRQGRRWQLLLVGCGPWRSTVEERERLARLWGDPPRVQAQAVGAREAFWLVTCNRVELYLGVGGDARAARNCLKALRTRWSQAAGSDAVGRRALRRLKVRRGRRAMHHLVEVVAGLDSRVHGESEIVAQVRQAYRQACRAGQVSGPFHQLLQGALAAGRRVRGPRRGCTGESVARVAAWAAAGHLRPVRGQRALVLGTGHVAAECAATLRRLGFAVAISGRDPSRTERLARVWGVVPVAWDARHGAALGSELVVAATRAEEFVLVAREAEPNGPAPRLVVDLGMPRNVEPQFASRVGATLWTLDDLGGAAELARRVPEAQVAREAAVLWRRLSRRVPADLLARLDGVAPRAAEEVLDELNRRLPGLEGPAGEELRKVVRRAIRRALHPTLVRLGHGADREHPWPTRRSRWGPLAHRGGVRGRSQEARG